MLIAAAFLAIPALLSITQAVTCLLASQSADTSTIMGGAGLMVQPAAARVGGSHDDGA
jgi:hypothetical protein